MDKELEIPEWVRQAIKDADTEKQAREIWEKAHGLDIVKPRLQKTREQLHEVAQENTQIKAQIQDLREMVAVNDFDSFFQALKIPAEKILQWAVDKANYEELPPDQRQILDRQQASERQNRLYQKQLAAQEAQSREYVSQAKAYGLQAVMAKPEVQSFAEAFDSRAGKQGAFWEEVCTAGEMAWYSSEGKVDLTPEQAVQQVMGKYGKFVSPAAPAAPQAPAAPNGQTPPAAQKAPAQKPPVIPNVGAAPQSPMPKKPGSVEDLKKIYEKKFGSGKTA
jgi:hypothetical protein